MSFDSEPSGCVIQPSRCRWRRPDVAYAVYRFAPLQGPDNPESFGTPQEQGRRIAAFCRAYGPGVGAEVVDVVPDRLQALIDFMRDQAARGNEAFQQHIAEGHIGLYEADIRYVRAHRDTLRAAFEMGHPCRTPCCRPRGPAISRGAERWAHCPVHACATEPMERLRGH
ncbi:hypothetical protein ACFYT4_26970 [Streptomyces sp. NPDC004609]|uniref:hypothetical protein n=1 Tax=Streptomyces sp. NPDC004609 TaxID=3364704 RepID=UPI0036C9992E